MPTPSTANDQHDASSELGPDREDAKHPLRGEIALCLSGGGYRAAAFHLGTLSTLEDLGLRENVKVLSSLSGGAVFSACYAISLCKGENFADFSHRFHEILRTQNPMAEAFKKLPDSGSDTKPPSLIRAMADAYSDKNLIGQTRFGELMASDAVPDDLIFGATEFTSGMAFRFQLSRRSNPHVGNRPPLNIATEATEDLRVADIVAASSCFPAAFEPMIFPDDFSWTEPLEQVRDHLTEELCDGVPLMDGGIYDNQAVDGAMAVYRRSGMSAGLLLVCDSSPRAANLYEPPSSTKRGGPTLRTLRRIGWAFFAGSLISASALFFKAFTEIRENDFDIFDSLLFGLPVLVCLGLAWTLRLIDQRVSIEQDRIRDATSVALWPNISQLRLLDFIDLVNARLLSLVSLTSDIFMKRVRSLIQTSLRIGPRFRRRVISNQIYDLDSVDRSAYKEHPWLRPKEHLVAMAKEAEAMPSILWFNNQRELDNLVLCGRATTCQSLLLFLLRHEKAALEDLTTPEAQLFTKAKSLWDGFNSPG